MCTFIHCVIPRSHKLSPSPSTLTPTHNTLSLPLLSQLLCQGCLQRCGRCGQLQALPALVQGRGLHQVQPSSERRAAGHRLPPTHRVLHRPGLLQAPPLNKGEAGREGGGREGERGKDGAFLWELPLYSQQFCLWHCTLITIGGTERKGPYPGMGVWEWDMFSPELERDLYCPRFSLLRRSQLMADSSPIWRTCGSFVLGLTQTLDRPPSSTFG